MTHSSEFDLLVNDARSRIQETTVDGYLEMKKQGMPHQLIDVREESEWAKGHIPGAIHIGKGVIERDIVQKVPEKSTTLVLYCGGGYRSALAADNLQKMGYTHVISMDGGWRGWTTAGHPTEA